MSFGLRVLDSSARAGRSFAYLLLCSLSLSAAAADSFKCPGLKPATQQSPAYRSSSDGRQCEGFFEQEIAGPYLELVSFIRIDSEEAKSGEALKLHASPRASQFVVLPLRQGVPYRVDMANVADGAQWQPKGMLSATGLRITDLGFLALESTSSDDRLDIVPTSIGKVATAGPSVAVIRSSERTKEMRWRMTPVGKADGASAAWQPLPSGSVEKWGLAAIQIAIPRAEAGPHVVQVQARKQDGTLLPLLQLLHPIRKR